MATDTTEVGVLQGRRAYPVTQQLFAGSPIQRLASSTEVGWHDSNATTESGAFALVLTGGALEQYVGDRVQVTYAGRSTIVYVVEAVATLPWDISLWRRAFMELAGLPFAPVLADVDLIG